MDQTVATELAPYDAMHQAIVATHGIDEVQQILDPGVVLLAELTAKDDCAVLLAELTAKDDCAVLLAELTAKDDFAALLAEMAAKDDCAALLAEMAAALRVDTQGVNDEHQ